MRRHLIPLLLPVTLLAGACTSTEAERAAASDAAWSSIVADLYEDPRTAPILERAADHRVQLLLSEVASTPDGPVLYRHGLRICDEYWYPASAIKLCAAVAALERLKQLDAAHPGWTPTVDTPLTYHALFEDEVTEAADASNLDGGAITVRHEIRKIFIVSDNRAHNRMAELATYDGIHESMWDAGLSSARLIHRLSEFRSPQDQRRTPDIGLRKDDETWVTVEGAESQEAHDSSHLSRVRVGLAHMAGNERIEGPMDFTWKNSISIHDLQDCLIKVVRPDVDLGTPGFDLTDADRALCWDAMTVAPGDSPNPRYDSERHPDDWYKWLAPGIRAVRGDAPVTIANKVGRAYGFSIENAYVVDEQQGRAFFLTAVIYTNPNFTVNDGVYGYAEVADPFFEGLGEILARHLLGDGADQDQP